MEKKIKTFWENRSQKKLLAGSNNASVDIFETNYISSQISKNKKILDVGCGNGIFLKRLLKIKKYKEATGIDFSGGMIKAAKRLNLSNTVFRIVDITNNSSLKKINEKFDVIVTKRALINISSHKRQLKILDYLGNFLKKGGKILCCENSRDSLKNINKVRKKIKLKKIDEPWHNTYFDDAKLKRYKFKNLKLHKVHEFASTFYFLSRIVNALVTKKENKSSFNKSINEVGMQLDQDLIKGFSQNIIYELRRKFS